MRPTAEDIESVFYEGQAAVITGQNAAIKCPYLPETWESSVFYKGVDKQISIWLVDDLKEMVAARKHATDRLERLQGLLGEIMATDEN